MEQNVVLVTTQEECNAIDGLLRLGFKIIYSGERGWKAFQYTSIYINIIDSIIITQVDSINIYSTYFIINNLFVPIYMCNNLTLNTLH